MSWIGTAVRIAAGQALRNGNQQASKKYLGTLSMTDYRDMIRILRQVDKEYLATLRKNIRKVAKPVQKGIAGTIPKTPPTSGIHVKDPKRTVSGFAPMVVPGRLTWGSNVQNGGIKANHVGFEFTKQKTWRKVGRLGRISIARLVVDNAGTVMADMAGRSKKWINKRPYTRPYLYSRSTTSTGKYGSEGQFITVRRHRINGQGVGMIRALDKGKNVQQGKASRWVWPTVDKYSDKTRMEVVKLLDDANRHLTERLKTR